MFNAPVYTNRRSVLKESLKSGLILLLANREVPMNYPANGYHFRQDSTFLYYTGIDDPDIALLIDVDQNREFLFANELQIDDIIWMGRLKTFREKANDSGIAHVKKTDELDSMVQTAKREGRIIHFIYPYRADLQAYLAGMIGVEITVLKSLESQVLIRSVIKQRSIKDSQEITEIESAHDVTRSMHTTAMRMAKAGIRESEISGTIEGIALSRGSGVAFPVILSVRGEVLHNHGHANIMQDGDLLVNDSGAESRMHYAADITRTIPVSGSFSKKQKEIYQIVLNAQLESIAAIKPGIAYKDIHLLAAKIIANGLKDLGLMKGDMDQAVEQGAHALFFPHGLGHMMGLDVHDMENLGEDLVGYDDSVKRSDQFGLAYLRLAKKLEPGHVLTIEPGIYFIPELIEQWKSTKKFDAFIEYGNVEKYLKFGGIRIEDDLLVTETGQRVLGQPIPKHTSEVEDLCRQTI